MRGTSVQRRGFPVFGWALASPRSISLYLSHRGEPDQPGRIAWVGCGGEKDRGRYSGSPRGLFLRPRRLQRRVQPATARATWSRVQLVACRCQSAARHKAAARRPSTQVTGGRTGQRRGGVARVRRALGDVWLAVQRWRSRSAPRSSSSPTRRMYRPSSLPLRCTRTPRSRGQTIHPPPAPSAQ